MPRTPWRRSCGLVLALFCLLLDATAGLAADGDGNFAVEGMGNLPCARFADLQDRRDSDYAAALGWMDGYLSAFNQLQPGTYDLTPWQDADMLAGAVRSVCTRYGEVRLVEAVNALIAQLAPDRLTVATPLRRLDNGGQGVVVYDTVLGTLRDRLYRLAYLDDAATPLQDQRLFLALGRYQADLGLAVTGLPDPPTLLALLTRQGPHDGPTISAE